MDSSYFLSFSLAYFLTLIIEGIIVWFFLRKTISITKLLLAIIVANTITLPFVWFFFPFLSDYLTFLIISELFAFIAEALLYFKILKLKLINAVKISLIANLVSFLIGFFLF